MSVVVVCLGTTAADAGLHVSANLAASATLNLGIVADNDSS